MHGDDADQIVIGGKDDRSETVTICNCLPHAAKNNLLLLTQGVAIDPVICDDGKLRGVDRIGPLAQDVALRTFLAAVYEKLSRILKIRLFLGVIGCENLRSPQRGPITREHVSDLALSDGYEVGFVDSIGERKEHVDTAAQDLRLEPGLATKRDEARFD
jgi:hypothetical protein